MKILIFGGHVVDPGRLDGLSDILVENGRIVDIKPPSVIDPSFADECIDASGKHVVPGLIDIHVHFREPGQIHKETIETGCRAAAKGGFTAVCTMPNTQPAADSADTLDLIRKKTDAANGVKIYPAAAITKDLKGRIPCNLAALKKAGAVAVTDDGMPVMNSAIMRQAMTEAKSLGLLVISHSEDIHLAEGGVINEGPTADRLGVKGIPNAAESIAVMREIALCELTGAPLHLAHISTKGSVDAIRQAKSQGLPVSAETGPHYFLLTEKAVETCGTHAKMNPPLRSEEDREAVRRALADGTLDVIATDHAPHSPEEKQQSLEKAPNGIIGLETSLPCSLRLVYDGLLTFSQMIEKMSVNPAKILGIDNRLKIGNPADVTIIDLNAEYTVDAEQFESKSRNTPFDGWAVKGKAVLTMVDGKTVFHS